MREHSEVARQSLRSQISIGILALSLIAGGCCHNYYPSLPTRPSETSGWRHTTDGEVLTVGSFVLKKGESTESDKLGVTMVDLKPSRLCAGPLAEPSAAQLTLRLYRPSDHKIICEKTVFIWGEAISGGTRLDCNDDTLPYLYVRSYNAKEEWAWLELRSTPGDATW